MFMKSIKMHNGAVFATGLYEKWLFTGGLDKTVNVQVKYGFASVPVLLRK